MSCLANATQTPADQPLGDSSTPNPVGNLTIPTSDIQQARLHGGFLQPSAEEWNCPPTGADAGSLRSACLACGQTAAECGAMVANFCQAKNCDFEVGCSPSSVPECNRGPKSATVANCLDGSRPVNGKCPNQSPEKFAPFASANIKAKPVSQLKPPAPPDAGSAPKPGSNPNPDRSATPDGQPERQIGSDPSTDKNTCQQLQQAATDCCRNPASCVMGYNPSLSGFQPDSSTGLRQDCQQAQGLGNTGSAMNANAATECRARWTECVDTCNLLASDYSGEETAGFLKGIASSCNSLSAYSQRYGQLGYQNAQTGSAGAWCNNMAGMNPQSLGNLDPTTGTPNYQANRQAMNDAYGCQANPNSPTCRAMAAALDERPRGKAAFQGGTAEKGSKSDNFNTGMPSDGLSVNPTFGKVDIKPQKVEPIPPGGGGSGFPGVDGAQSARQASLPPAPARGAAAPGKGAEIDPNITRSGGYSQDPQQPVYDSNNPTVQARMRAIEDGRDPAAQRMDLKKYLPGGLYDGHRATGYHIKNSEFAGRYADMWKNVSLRIQEKCRLGVLFDCR